MILEFSLGDHLELVFRRETAERLHSFLSPILAVTRSDAEQGTLYCHCWTVGELSLQPAQPVQRDILRITVVDVQNLRFRSAIGIVNKAVNFMSPSYYNN